MKNILKAASVIVLLGLPLQVEAISIAIANPGFEDPNTTQTFSPPDNWTVSGGGAGVWNLTTFSSGFWTVGAPQGNQIAYVSDAPNPGSPATLSQILSTPLAANTIYDLSGYVGHPSGNGVDYSVGTVYTVSLYAGGNLLDSLSGTGPGGSFTTFNLNYDSTGSAFVGQLLEIRLSSNKAQTGFDAIALEATAGAAAVPDGGFTILLLGLGMTALGWMRRKMS